MRVPEDKRPPGEDVIDVAVAVDVEKPGPFPALDEQRLASDRLERPHRRIDSPGKERQGLGEERAGLFEFQPRLLRLP